VPVDTPQVKPVVEPTVAMVGSPLLHVPPLTGLDRVIHAATHTADPPLIGPGPGVIVSVRVAVQPEPNEYVTVTVPVDIAVTNPLVEPMVATDGLLLVHVPPPEELVQVVVAPTHKLLIPDIAPGGGVTVNDAVVKQPVAVNL